MGVTPYKFITLNKNDTITLDLFHQLAANYQWINDHTPRSRYTLEGRDPTRDAPLIIAGRVHLKRPPKENFATARVRFPKGFHPNCRPHVTTAVVSDQQTRVHCVVAGPDGKPYPQATGFEVSVFIEPPPPQKGPKEPLTAKQKRRLARKPVEKGVWVSWHAFGFRPEAERV
jgi:hypothetical protein